MKEYRRITDASEITAQAFLDSKRNDVKNKQQHL